MSIWAKIRKGVLVAAMVVTGALYAQTSPGGTLSTSVKDCQTKKNSTLLLQAKAGERPALAQGKDGAGLSAIPVVSLASTAKEDNRVNKPARKEGRGTAYRKEAQSPVVRWQGNQAPEKKYDVLHTGTNATIKTNPGMAAIGLRPSAKEVSPNTEKDFIFRKSTPDRQAYRGQFPTGRGSAYLKSAIPPLVANFKGSKTFYLTKEGLRYGLPPLTFTFGCPTDSRMQKPGGCSHQASRQELRHERSAANYGLPPKQSHRTVGLFVNYLADFSKVQNNFSDKSFVWTIPDSLGRGYRAFLYSITTSPIISVVLLPRSSGTFFRYPQAC